MTEGLAEPDITPPEPEADDVLPDAELPTSAQDAEPVAPDDGIPDPDTDDPA